MRQITYRKALILKNLFLKKYFQKIFKNINKQCCNKSERGSLIVTRKDDLIVLLCDIFFIRVSQWCAEPCMEARFASLAVYCILKIWWIVLEGAISAVSLSTLDCFVLFVASKCCGPPAKQGSVFCAWFWKFVILLLGLTRRSRANRRIRDSWNKGFQRRRWTWRSPRKPGVVISTDCLF